MSKANGVLDLVMKNVWFDKIKAGEKKIEYREVKKSWASKIYENGKPAVKLALFSRDYRRKEQMLFEIEKIEVLTSGIETDLKINKPVYAIHLGKQLNIVDWYKEQKRGYKNVV